ncbi:MAG: dTDP-4-dehydrorhamnose reductase [Deltaproteobacteria bacterium]|nr:dTDP-4-dehydrorhamnose reductase [Candidatus Anaeroferrophillacea bacterium]
MNPEKTILLFGARGMLGSMITHGIPPGMRLHAVDRTDGDITDEQRVMELFSRLRPEVIINAAACTRVDDCETDPDSGFLVNAEGPGIIARAAARHGATLIHISSDYVFDGGRRTPYREDDPPRPLSRYGTGKLAGEEAIRDSGLSDYYIVRTSWLFGPYRDNFVTAIARQARLKEELTIVADQTGSPTFTADLVRGIFALLEQHAAPGIYHFANRGSCTWFEFGREIIARLRHAGEPLAVNNIRPISSAAFNRPAPRPAYSVLDTTKFTRATGIVPPDWQAALATYLNRDET